MARPRQYPIQVSVFINQGHLEWLYANAKDEGLGGISTVIRQTIEAAMLADPLAAQPLISVGNPLSGTEV